MEFVKINRKEIPAEISGMMNDYSWDGRESKTIMFTDTLTYDEVAEIFAEGVTWSIISEWQEEQFDEQGNPFVPPQYITKREEFDNSDFNMAGEITDYRDGRVSVKMAKLSELEALIEEVYGRVN